MRCGEIDRRIEIIIKEARRYARTRTTTTAATSSKQPIPSHHHPSSPPYICTQLSRQALPCSDLSAPSNTHPSHFPPHEPHLSTLHCTHSAYGAFFLADAYAAGGMPCRGLIIIACLPVVCLLACLAYRASRAFGRFGASGADAALVGCAARGCEMCVVSAGLCSGQDAAAPEGWFGGWGGGSRD